MYAYDPFYMFPGKNGLKEKSVSRKSYVCGITYSSSFFTSLSNSLSDCKVNRQENSWTSLKWPSQINKNSVEDSVLPVCALSQNGGKPENYM